jgi:hypothetical protein
MALTDVLTYQRYALLTGTPPSTDSASIARINALITATTRRLELLTGSYFIQRAYVESHVTTSQNVLSSFGTAWVMPTSVLVLKRRPILEVLVNDVRTSPAVYKPDGEIIAMEDFIVEPESAMLYHTTQWPRIPGVWTVSVMGGFWPNTAAVADDLALAAALLVQGSLNPSSTGGRRVSSEAVGPVRVSYQTAAVAQGIGIEGLPPDVAELIRPYMQVVL